MKTRRWEKRRPDDIVRWCRHCKITNNDTKFLVQKNSRTGKFYIHNICAGCYEDIRKMRRAEYYEKNRDKQILEARQWNILNKDRYNARRRKKEFRWWTRTKISINSFDLGGRYEHRTLVEPSAEG